MDCEFEEIWSKMTGGEVYDATHRELVKRLEDTHEKMWKFNQLRPSQQKEQHDILDSLPGGHGENYHFNRPFRCDYGCNVFIGAGSVVTGSFPDNVVIGGNPAKVIKRIPPNEGHQHLGLDSCGE